MTARRVRGGRPDRRALAGLRRRGTRRGRPRGDGRLLGRDAATRREGPLPHRCGGPGPATRRPEAGGAGRAAVRLPHRRERVQAQEPPAAAGQVQLRRGGQDRRLRPAPRHEGGRAHPLLAQPVARLDVPGPGRQAAAARRGVAESQGPHRRGRGALQGEGDRLGRGQRGDQRREGRLPARHAGAAGDRRRLHRQGVRVRARGRPRRRAVLQRLRQREPREAREDDPPDPRAQGQGRASRRGRDPVPTCGWTTPTRRTGWTGRSRPMPPRG